MRGKIQFKEIIRWKISLWEGYLYTLEGEADSWEELLSARDRCIRNAYK